MTSTRRPATAADVTTGATVYKGKGKVAYRVLRSEHGLNANADVLYVWVIQATTKSGNGAGCELEKLTVEG